MIWIETPRGMFRIARAATALGILGLLLDGIFWRTALHVTLWSHLGCIAFLGAIFAVLTVAGEQPGEGAGSAALMLCVAVILGGLCVSDQMLARSGPRWTPFEAQRLGILAVALLAPPRVSLGLGCIAAQVVVPLAEWAMWGPAVRARLPISAPWLVVAYGLFACVIYGHQMARLALERRAALAQAEADSLERFARLILSVRDLANTPLQTIELTVGLLRNRGSCDERALARLERAAQRLAAVGRALEEPQVTLPQVGGRGPRRRGGYWRSFGSSSP